MAILLLFLLSGCAGLVYEVVWVRMLTRVFGTTTFAVSALLTAFMTGLGLGSYLSGRLLAARGRALRWFGLLEWGVGLYALGLPWLLPAAERVFTGAVSNWGLTHHGESLLKLVLALVLLVPPATLMGATLPLLAHHAVDRLGHLASRVGALYAVNTLGAVLGCAAAGFVGIPALGLWRTTLVAAGANFLVGSIALVLSRRDDHPRAEAAPPESAPAAAVYPRSSVRWAIAGFALSGFVALGLEVIWTRLIALVFTGFTYSFTTMLTVFLAGIAGGSLVASRFADRLRDPLRALGLVEVAIGVSALVLAPLFVQAQGWVRALGPRLGGGWSGEATAKLLVGFVLLLVPTLLFGATFPMVARVAARGVGGVGALVGRLYSANVAGGIAGSFVTGYVLIPALGSHQSLRVLCGSLVLLGVGLVSASPLATPRARAAAALFGAGGALAAVALGPADVSRAIHLRWLVAGERLAFYAEGVEATVMVGETRTEAGTLAKRILVTGSSASNSSYYGLSVNRIQGVLPFLFERMPRKVLAICFGTGITFGTLTQFTPERVDGVEIAPEVLRAAPQFASANYDVLTSPVMRLHVDDGRNFLLKSHELYDAITMEPMPPAQAGMANFYTRDFYALCRRHLAPGGIVSQWVPLYFLGPRDLQMLYGTFAESFPHVLVFGYEYDTFLVGSDRPLDLSARRFRERLRSQPLARDLAALELGRPEQFLATFLMGREGARRFAGDAPILTDDLPYVEFTGPKSATMDFTGGNYHAVMAEVEPGSRFVEEGDPEAAAMRAHLDGVFSGRQGLSRPR